ncbi:hypothetical protein [Candidatus Magnetaquicoccus inordinatus]|uniref:hypothetical protein n=1 Tax=Candidatus Magnetaquicoccus inordinatus TaxID=2496818 RepID=UPI00102CFEC0|nr:hypothetical protein [Candidatus Magnetaquicoccus inordinatus]
MTLLLLSLHILAATIWIGGMFFAHVFLRPATLQLEIEPRIDLWYGIFSRFFPWVWAIILILPLSGYALLHTTFANPNPAPTYIRIMQWLGWSMIFLFVFLFLAHFRNMAKMVKKRLLPEAAIYLNRIRIIVSINLFLGLVTIMVATTGRYW